MLAQKRKNEKREHRRNIKREISLYIREKIKVMAAKAREGNGTRRDY